MEHWYKSKDDLTLFLNFLSMEGAFILAKYDVYYDWELTQLNLTHHIIDWNVDDH